MLVVALCSLLLLVLTTVIHCEALRVLGSTLPRVNVPGRSKLVIVILAAFFAHALEMLLYGGAFFLLVNELGLGGLGESPQISFAHTLYFSAETYTSLGFGDIVPTGPIRLLVGAEALNGLLLIGWSASYIYLAMERYWKPDALHGPDD